MTLAIHQDEGNPHAHLLISRRSINDKGEWSWAKDREITTKAALIETRKLWAEICNFELEREGFERIDHRSFVDLGLDYKPTQHEGWFAHKIKETGGRSRIILENEKIKAENKETLSFNPDLVLKELTIKQATFSPLQLSRAIQYRLQDDAKLATYVYELCLEKAIVVGTGLDGQLRYTSPEYFHKESEALKIVESLANAPASIELSPNAQETLLKNNYSFLTQEQKQAIGILCGNQQFSLMVGRAGTGKTTSLKAVVELHKQANYQVIGLSLSASAAENLSTEAKCDAETLAFYLDKWNRFEGINQKYWSPHPSHEHGLLQSQLNILEPYQLTKNHLVLVDEAGMIGTSQWNELLTFVHKAGAKLIAVGDDHQFKAIEAGDFFRKLKDIAQTKNSFCQLDKIMRQKENWMQEASIELSNLNTHQALAAYEQQGHIKKIQSGKEGVIRIAQAYTDRILKEPNKSGLLLAYTRAECQDLNLAIRRLLQKQALIGRDDTYINGRPYAINDQIVFLKNDRLKKVKGFDPNTGKSTPLLIKNGTQGEIIAIEKIGKEANQVQITATINQQIHAVFIIKEYGEIEHNYASTLHKSQGQTVDWSFVVASKYMDAYASYVALTRHREDLTLFYDENLFPSFKALQSSLAQIGNKDLVIDYTINPENQYAWENIQEYRLLGQDLAATVKEKNLTNYQAIKNERKALGKIILTDWEAHRDYVRQAGLTQESISIACDLKMRPLSTLELQAQQTVQTYSEKAIQARLLWQAIRTTHPGRHCYQHALYAEFTQLRQERNDLAKSIVLNPIIHREFIQSLAQARRIGWATLHAQAKQTIHFEKTDFSQARKEETFYQDRIDHSQSSFEYKLYHKTPSFKNDIGHIREDLNRQIASLARSLLGDPKTKTAREWRYGNKGSISVCIAGTKQGLYANFERGTFGGPLKLIEECLQLDPRQAFKWAIDWVGNSQVLPPRPFNNETKRPLKDTLTYRAQWIPVFPVPLNQQSPNLISDNHLSYQLTHHNRHEVARYAYKDAAGNLLGYSVRLENKQGEKVVLPLTYCQNRQGKQQWRWQGFGDDRPLYGLNKLALNPSKPVLMVEGEKTADVAQQILPDWVVMSWPSGAGSIHKVDWSPLLGKPIVLWPDNDVAGKKAMQKLESILLAIHQKQNQALCIKTVQLPEFTPEKWDLADPLPANWTLSQINELLSATEIGKSIVSQSISLDLFDKVLSAHQLSLFQAGNCHTALESANDLYKESISWHTLLNIPIDETKHLAIKQKSIIAGALQEWIQEKYFNQEKDSISFRKSTDVALIAAEIKLNSANSYRNEAEILVAAYKIFEFQDKKIQTFSSLHTADNPSTELVKTFNQEKIRCFNQTTSLFNQSQAEHIVSDIKSIQKEIILLSDKNLVTDQKLVPSAIINEVLNLRRQKANLSLSNAIKEMTSKMNEGQISVAEKTNRLSLPKNINFENEHETQL